MQTICTSVQTDNHTNITQFLTGRMLFVTPNQQCQSTEGIKSKNSFSALTLLVGRQEEQKKPKSKQK